MTEPLGNGRAIGRAVVPPRREPGALLDPIVKQSGAYPRASEFPTDLIERVLEWMMNDWDRPGDAYTPAVRVSGRHRRDPQGGDPG